MTIIISLFLFLPSLAAPKEVVTRAVVEVGSHVVTSREVMISSLLDRALQIPTSVMPSKVSKKDWGLIDGSAEFEKQLSQLILERVVLLEAENFSLGKASTEEHANISRHANSVLKEINEWKKLEVTEAEFEQAFSRKLRVKNFLKFKRDSYGVQVNDEDVKNYYEKNRVKFGELPLAQFKESIREYLSQEQLQERLKDWFEILKRKYRVRRLGKT